MLACELTSLPRCKSTRNWSYYSRNKRSHVCLCRDSENYTAFHRDLPLMCFTRNDVVPSVEHCQSRTTAIQGKSMRIQYTNQWLPRVSVFLRVSLAGIANTDRSPAIDSCFFIANDMFPQAHPSSIRLHEMLIVIYFQVKFVGILIRRGRAYFFNHTATFNFEEISWKVWDRKIFIKRSE